MTRTPMDRITRQPLMISLGGVEYAFHPKCIRDAEVWRNKASVLTNGGIAAVVYGEWDNKDELDTLIDVKGNIDDSIMLKVLHAWEPELDWDTIERNTFSDELNLAFWEVVMMGYPFVLRKALALIKRKVIQEKNSRT